ncbi:MAG: UDP-N-acetylmuramoyl-tripeptide--D-alanyl-D-alanine ligase [Phycisphaeraceae bacterium]|nr:UDP-N-acetylmuramoyl-tripeptide--D-alanyl-D-alanine ligase [Phycisphaeraceae bacterium]MCW5754024.1 UDP-N-acetylmuramoyl-tripeptide--D-alanyl-D-alanine ligase [Phycisphaeraceae bacterium]
MNSSPQDFWLLERLRLAIGAGAQWLLRPQSHDIRASGASIDTRTLRPGQIFFALKGAQADGHRFLPHAARAGAAFAVIDNPEAVAPDLSIPVLAVPDTQAAMVKLARAYRRAADAVRVVGVTGSAGKTTTTRLIDAALRTRLRGSASIKSFNNRLGVSLTMLNANPADQYLVSEVGTSAPGEIAELAALLEPSIAVITLIGRAHLEGLGSLQGVAAEKIALAQALRPGGLAVIPAPCPSLEPHLRSLTSVLRVGLDLEADIRITDITSDHTGVAFTLNDRTTYRVPLLGRHNAVNAAMAVAVARRFGIPPEDIARGLLEVQPPEGRLARVSIAGIDIIHDAYNANPESMLAAIAVLADCPARRRVLILGDMLELGPHAPDAHREVLRAAKDHPAVDLILAVGPNMTAASLPRTLGAPVETFPDLGDDDIPRIAAHLRPDDLVLIKASRAMRLERLLDALRAPLRADDAPAA